MEVLGRERKLHDDTHCMSKGTTTVKASERPVPPILGLVYQVFRYYYPYEASRVGRKTPGRGRRPKSTGLRYRLSAFVLARIPIYSIMTSGSSGPFDDAVTTAEELDDALHELLITAYSNGVDPVGSWVVRNGSEVPDWEVEVSRLAKLE